MIQTNVPSAIIPKPPNCKIRAKTIMPAIVNVSEIVTTDNPVTLTALTDVNKASINVHFTPAFVTNGKLSNITDTTTANK